MTDQPTIVRLTERWCSCLAQPVVSLRRAERAIALLEPCWAHAAIGPAGFAVGERRHYHPGSLIDRAVERATKETASA